MSFKPQQIFYVDSIPTAAIGKVNDIALHSNGNVYRKAGGAWALLGNIRNLDDHTHIEANITDLDHDDADAIHNNVASEISAITEKGSPVSADLIVIEDSADSNNKKRVQVGNLPTGGEVSYIELRKTGSAQQNHGGANGTEVVVSWDSEDHKGGDFTHDTVTNNSRIQCDFDGRVVITGLVGVTQGGSARTTTMARFRVNGGATNVLGTTRNYSRGSGYGDLSVEWDFELDVSDGDYIELVTVIDDTDATYTMNSIVAECFMIVRRLDVGLSGVKGDDGAAGADGADGDITWEGAWTTATSYTTNEAVSSNGSSYVCILNHTSGASSEPGVGGSWATYWDVLASSATGIDHYMLPIWAEENSSLAATTYEWAFGNGANTPNGAGVVVYVPSGYTCEVVAMSLQIGGTTPSAVVELELTGVLQGALCNVTCSAVNSAVNSAFTPVAVVSGDIINFRTTSASSTAAPCVVTAWLKFTVT